MVAGNPAFGFVVVFKHREVNHPQRFPVFGSQAFFVTDFDTQGANGVVHYFCAIRTKEDNVAVLCTGTLQNRFQCVITNVFHDR